MIRGPLVSHLLLYAGHKINVLDSVHQEVCLSSFGFTLFKGRELAYCILLNFRKNSKFSNNILDAFSGKWFQKKAWKSSIE